MRTNIKWRETSRYHVWYLDDRFLTYLYRMIHIYFTNGLLELMRLSVVDVYLVVKIYCNRSLSG